MQISSLQNPKVKELVRLSSHSSLRRECGLFIVEGLRELCRCIEAGYEVDSLFYCPEIIGETEPNDDWRQIADALCVAKATLGKVALQGTLSMTKCNSVNRQVYDKIAYRGGTEGVVAVVHCKTPLRLPELKLKENPLVVVMESVEKPGNLGAMLRTAESCGTDLIIVCDPLTDIYNPNLIRASLGAVFALNVVACSSEEAISWLKSNNIKILTAQLQDSKLYYDTDMTCGVAVVLGSEADGLSQQWRVASDAKIRIPMLGRVDSLNVSVAMGILCYEALRQRMLP